MDAGAPHSGRPMGGTSYSRMGAACSLTQTTSSGNDEITGEIHRVTFDGSDLQLILAGEGPDAPVFHSPRISPDGTRIVYVTTWYETEEGEPQSSEKLRN